ncbi:aminotransferase class IV [Agreia pratensis]|uniref:Branched-chain amino acid aminotransferase/4-amino-4-deoxychorismate lyase n=1 Tax=Agreia pratensis TaxID=150121 RepID=A0A1X7KZY9_9MICO|nr:aminotransferase class IV [Agreia pratensis]SMG46804.1 Branched-chain amino acid aminotransferase/4-amino-4-deoxychorismate lyase [Agreia pratensis]
MIAPRFFVWTGRELAETPDVPAHDGVLVADSWLVADGGVRALQLHRDRFLRGVASQTSIDSPATESFWQAAVDALPRTGEWFPRVEALLIGGEPTLALRLRPAPPLGASVRVASLDEGDPRTVSTVKGPDIERLGALKSEAAQNDVDEPIIVSAAGHIIDGATSAVLWWRGDRLFAPSASLGRVDSVTAKSIRLLATATGTDTGEEFATPADLAGCEVWVVNALHGIRVVTSWRNGPALARTHGRATAWQRRLDALVRPIS